MKKNDFHNYWSGKNVVITGGLGFLGSNLAHRLDGLGAHLTLIDSLAPLYGGNWFNIETIKERHTVIIDSYCNIESYLQYIAKADVIFHFAAQVSYIDSITMPYDDLDLNARGTLQLLEACRKHNSSAKILFSSSRMVLGKVETKMMTEESPTNPLSLYGIHKLTSEKYLQMYHKDFGIPTVILRITNPYGPRQQIKHSKYSLIGWFIRQAMEGKTIQIFGEGRQIRDYIYVDDIINAFLSAGATQNAVGHILNVGSGTVSEFREMVHAVVDIVKSGDVTYVPWPDNYERIETGDVAADISKLVSMTGWKPAYGLRSGIEATYSYYKENYSNYVIV